MPRQAELEDTPHSEMSAGVTMLMNENYYSYTERPMTMLWFLLAAILSLLRELFVWLARALSLSQRE